MLKIRKAGLELSPKAKLKASETSEGNWVAWLEVSGVPISDQNSGKPKLFEGPTRYQAQCAAYRWFCPDAAALLKN